MAAIIEFYLPMNFRPKSPCSSMECGKVIEFCSYADAEILETGTSVNLGTPRSAVAQNSRAECIFAED